MANPRLSAASSSETYTISRIEVPKSIEICYLHKIFQPLKQDLLAMEGTSSQTEISSPEEMVSSEADVPK